MNSIIKPLAITFSESPAEEIEIFFKELNISSLLPLLEKDNEELPEKAKQSLGELIYVIGDLFGSSLPSIQKEPEKAIRQVIRDINLSRILRERGIARLYLFLKETVRVDGVDLPIILTRENPFNEEGQPFRSQEDFLKWFCKAASVSRALVFMRLATYDRLTKTLGYTLEEAYSIVTSKPSIIRETMVELVTWKGSEITHVDPEVAKKLGIVFNNQELEDAARALIKEEEKEDPDKFFIEELNNLIINEMPEILRNVLEQIKEHDSVQDASKWIKNDLLNKPEISYVWEPDLGGFYIEYHLRSIGDSGELISEQLLKFLMLPDFKTLPEVVVRDLAARLRMKNFTLDSID